ERVGRGAGFRGEVGDVVVWLEPQPHPASHRCHVGYLHGQPLTLASAMSLILHYRSAQLARRPAAGAPRGRAPARLGPLRDSAPDPDTAARERHAGINISTTPAPR